MTCHLIRRLRFVCAACLVPLFIIIESYRDTSQYSYITMRSRPSLHRQSPTVGALPWTLVSRTYRGPSFLQCSKAVRGVITFAALFRAGAAVAVIDQPRLPGLSGEHKHVGVRYTRCGGARVKLFYPASGPSDEEAPYCTDGRVTSDGMAGLVGFRQLGLSFLLEHLASARSGAWLDAPFADTEEPLPILVYSHGFGGNMDMASYLFRACVSRN